MRSRNIKLIEFFLITLLFSWKAANFLIDFKLNIFASWFILNCALSIFWLYEFISLIVNLNIQFKFQQAFRD